MTRGKASTKVRPGLKSGLSKHYTEILLSAAAAKGIDPSALFGDEPATGLGDARTRWNNYQLGLVSKNLKQISGDELWGMSQGRAPRGSLQFSIELCALSDTLGAGLRRAFRFFALATDGVRFDLQAVGDEAQITMELPGLDADASGLLFEWWLWFWHFVAQWLVGLELPVVEVEFPHRPIGSREDYDATFGPNWRFEGEAARIVFPASALGRRIVRSVEDVEAMHRKTAVTLRRPPELPLSFKTLITTDLLEGLNTSNTLPTLEALAEAHGVCSQTLRRRLRAEGTSYRALKAEVRRELARRLLGDPGSTLAETAALTGFTEGSALSRAIRGWTGMSAAEFRRTVRGAPNGRRR